MEEEIRGLPRSARETVTFETRQRFAMVSSVVGINKVLVGSIIRSLVN
jgi:hypothetical protein